MDWTWTFERDNRQLTLERRATAEGPVLVVVAEAGDAPHKYGFSTLPELVRFQNDMEAFLLKTGWTFRTFSPERRRGRDRRTFPRIDERRRWWTDGTITPNKVVWGP